MSNARLQRALLALLAIPALTGGPRGGAAFGCGELGKIMLSGESPTRLLCPIALAGRRTAENITFNPPPRALQWGP